MKVTVTSWIRANNSTPDAIVEALKEYNLPKEAKLVAIDRNYVLSVNDEEINITPITLKFEWEEER